MIFEFCIFTAAVKDHEWHWEKEYWCLLTNRKKETGKVTEREGKKEKKGEKEKESGQIEIRNERESEEDRAW